MNKIGGAFGSYGWAGGAKKIVEAEMQAAGIQLVDSDIDFVVVRENTEGFYADRNMEAGNSELLVTPEVAISLRRITRHC